MIEEYVKKYPSKAEFCRVVGIKNQQFLTQILKGTRPVPAKIAVRLYMMHNADLHNLCPDVFPINFK